MTNNTEWKRAKAAELMLEGLTPTAIAHALGVKRATVTQWQNHPTFKGHLEAVVRNLALQMDVQMMRADFAHFQSHYEGLVDFPHRSRDYYATTNIVETLKKKDFLAKISHESPNDLPTVGLDLADFGRNAQEHSHNRQESTTHIPDIGG